MKVIPETRRVHQIRYLVKQIDHWNIHKKNSNEVQPPNIAITV